ncbi:helix-turn-helix domain-containing protein [Ulvibacterium sp.]|uniref:helix-turn-helix transcriptional regulator n=1 Tax=Ulvibacterium sp. TaxID=2665914 RepID=UPI0026062049|nr:helix-turn-helix domain-containing protein [Ulvibacterium sp.]
MNITHNELPQAVEELFGIAKAIKTILDGKSNREEDEPMGLDRVVELDPLGRAKSTFYRYCQDPDSQFPYRKRGKHIIVLRSEFEAWLKLGQKNSNERISNRVDSILTSNTSKK